MQAVFWKLLLQGLVGFNTGERKGEREESHSLPGFLKATGQRNRTALEPCT